jgi:hypothetical protein
MRGLGVEDMLSNDRNRMSGVAAGRVTVKRGSQPACVELRANGILVTGPVCNRHLFCEIVSNPPSPFWSFDVFRLKAPDAYYVRTWTGCNSDCCDMSGMSFNGDGARLDDGVLQRVYLRLGIFGSAGGLVALLGLVLALGSPRTSTSRAFMLVGCVVATGMLWWNR